MGIEDDLAKLANAAVADWPEIAFSGELHAAIKSLYRTHLPFPPFWTTDECMEFIEQQADTDAQRLATQFDDAIEVAIDDFGRQNGYLPHHEDTSTMVDAARKDAVFELECSVESVR